MEQRITDFFGFDIRPYLSVAEFDSDDRIMEEGERPAFLYYMIKGRAKLFLSHENGRISLINFLDAPCFMGELELLGAQEKAQGITAITPCVCYAIRVEACRERLLSDPTFLRHICLFLGKKALGNTANYSRNQSYPLETRLAEFILLTMRERYYREKHTEVSEYLGVSYRHLLYVLADFVKRGFLKRTASGYYVEDVDGMRGLAGDFYGLRPEVWQQ